MKTTVPFLTALLFVLTSLSFSAAAKCLPGNAVEIDLPNGEYTGCFVQYTDGSIKQFATLKFVTGMFKTPHLLANDSIEIYAGDIKAYQTEKCFAVSQKEMGETRKSFVAKEALPGFAIRVAKGKLNVFSIKFYNGHNAAEKLYVQNDDKGTFDVCTKELLAELLKENSDAVSILQDKNKDISDVKKFLAAIESFNTAKLISKN